jgi:lipoprotein NlpD
MKNYRLLCPLASIFVLAACTTPRSPAPVIDRGTASRPGDANRTNAMVPRVADERGYYTVRKGDTLLHIAQEFGQNYRDLVVWNNLANANDIKVDQPLRVLPPDAGSGAPQAASVSVGSGVEVRPLGAAPSAAPPGTTPVPGAGVPNKIGPRGDKRAYSESALADLQKPESGNNTAAAPVPPVAALTPKPADTRTGEVKPAEKPAAGSTPAPLAEDDNVSWIWPTDGKVASGFDDGKKGIDIAGKSGQQVLAASAGKVMYAGSGIRGYCNLVIVKHTSNLLSAYAHNKTILVKEGQTVAKGQKIAEMGNSDSDSVKLHFEIRQQGKPVDPSKFLPAR